MKKTLLLLFILTLCIIYFSSSLTQVNSQVPDIYDYGVKIKAKTGDSNSIINNLGKHYFSTWVDSNGKFILVNITKGTTITVTVTAINQTTEGLSRGDQVYIQVNISIPGQKEIIGRETYGNSYIIPAFNNETIVDKYINDLTSSLQDSDLGISYSVNGDFINAESSYNSSTLISTEQISLNWKTGWLESTEQNNIATNGTTLRYVKLERVSNNLVNNVISYAIEGATILSVGTIVAVPILVFYSYKKFTTTSIQNKNVSFTQYLKTKGKKTKPKITRPTQTDKALDMIDEILQENK